VVKPKRDGCVPSLVRWQNATKKRLVKRDPRLYVCRNSELRRTRLVLGSDSGKTKNYWLFGVTHGALVTDREFVTAFGSPARQHGTAVSRFHANAESVRLCSLAVIRLKGTFWHFEVL
jgi:hypothetical protein